jgi:glycosyltransferase involved in cell wall biosynthesis
MSVESLTSQQPLVLILMGTFNGEKYIREQLDSIATQTYQNWKLVISDDGSTDQTLEVAKEWASEVGVDRVEFREGPRNGFAQNFLSMACDSNLRADFYAFSDQDDVWCRDKMSAGIKYLAASDASVPTLYCGTTIYACENLQSLKNSMAFKKPPSFENALVQSLAGGNTMLFNIAAKNLLEKTRPLDSVVSHDWWAYLLVTGCDGVVLYDKTPRVLYRQHEGNSVGANSGWFARLLRLKKLLKGCFRDWTDKNISALNGAVDFLSTQNREVLESFSAARKSNILRRYVIFKRLGIYRQTSLGSLGLFLAILLNKV